MNEPAESSQEPASSRTKKRKALLPIVILGVAAIACAWTLRTSDWAQERKLKTLNLEELALAVHDKPKDPLTLTYYAGKLLDADRADTAEQYFSLAIKERPDSVKAHVGMGSAQIRQRKLKQAQETFDKAVKLSPSDTEALLGQAQAYYMGGFAMPAIKSLEAIVKLQPRNGKAWYYLGRVAGDAKASDKAYNALQKATDLMPDNQSAWRDLGQVAYFFGKLDEAEGAIKRALKLNKSDAGCYLLLGRVYTKRAEDPKSRPFAEQAFLSALNYDPSMTAAHFELGMLYERGSAWQSAITHFRKATEQDASDDKALMHLGACLIRSGLKAEGEKLVTGAQKLSDAKREIEVLVKRSLAEPENFATRHQLAKVYVKWGNLDGAMAQYQFIKQRGYAAAGLDEEIAQLTNRLRSEQKANPPQTPPSPSPVNSSPAQMGLPQ